MNVNSINMAATSAPTNNTTNSGSVTQGVDQDTFLKLLVAQLKNQDPLEPQDGTQFVAQLAQFSSLDQLISINKTLGNALNPQGSTSQQEPNTNK
jgi:flagellar basal-body rod modification protein FlgD